jgi:L-iditol 2-dehydrogenase
MECASYDIIFLSNLRRIKMKCVIQSDGNIVIQSSNVYSATDGQCVFEVKASGICGSDIPRAFSNGAYSYPIVVGHEFSGIVKDSMNRELIGKRACVFPVLPCGKCKFCKDQQWASCTNYDYYGSRRDGGMQSELLVKESNLIFLPDSVSYEAGAMIEPMAVCLHAIKKANISDNSCVLVYGAGTIGLLSAMWAKALGAKAVFVCDVDKNRLDFAERLGFQIYSNETVDIIIEASGSASALNDSILNCEPFGKIILIGHGKKDICIKHEVFIKILRKQLTLIGSWNSDFSTEANDWEESVQAIANGVMNPEVLITHKIPLDKADEAFKASADRNVFSNKVMVVM